ncbi:MAG TPA: excinuclease ABC subunit B [Caulobacteraceae bacterium]|nr:excinuclease ABC subunit B [Caulobacteraceae bacterium]
MTDETDTDERIAALGLLMGRAIAGGDAAEARRLRDEIDRLAGVAPDARHGSRIGRGSPGAMGLGTDQPTLRKRAWTPPPRPDPMTTNTKAGGRRRKDG